MTYEPYNTQTTGEELPPPINPAFEPYAARLAAMNFEQLPKEKIAELVEEVVGELSVDDAMTVVERAAAMAELQGIMLQAKAEELANRYSRGSSSGALCGEGTPLRELGPEETSDRYFMAGYNEKDEGGSDFLPL